MSKAVVCIVDSDLQAGRIVDDLKSAGFRNDAISVLFSEGSATHDFAEEKHTKAPEGATTGGVTGGVLGGTLGWLAGIGSLAIPGLGPFIAAGPIMGALSGAAVGASVGGLTGALVGLGIPELETKIYEGKLLREKQILIAVHTDDREERARAKEIFEHDNAEQIATVGEAHA